MVNRYEEAVIQHNHMKDFFRKQRLLKEDDLDDQLGLGDEGSNTDGNDANTDVEADDSATNNDANANTNADAPIQDPIPDEPSDTTTDNDTETLDITDLVTKQDSIIQTLADLFAKFDELSKKQNSATQTVVSAEVNQTNRIDAELQDLRKEIEKRNPTKEEQMTLNSMTMYPYNVRLSDYFKPTDDMSMRYSDANTKPQSNGLKDAIGAPNETEYVLKQSDINPNPTFNVKKSFQYFG